MAVGCVGSDAAPVPAVAVCHSGSGVLPEESPEERWHILLKSHDHEEGLMILMIVEVTGKVRLPSAEGKEGLKFEKLPDAQEPQIIVSLTPH